jgi:hypothetical protein
MVHKFSILVHGHDPTAGEGPDGPLVGFCTVVFVEAPSASEAARKAVEMLDRDAHVQGAIREQGWGGSPVLKAAEVKELQSFDGCTLPRAGLGFYDERSVQ